VQKHYTIYVKSFGKLKPKHHFMVHYAKAIKKYGSLKYLWCMRFEARHNDSNIYFLLEIGIESMLKPRTAFLEIDHSQKPVRQEAFDDDLRIFSMNRSGPTFEIENTEIKNAENCFFSECSFLPC